MENRKKLILALAIIFALNIFVISLAQSAGAVTYGRGSSGETVKQIQTRLRDWGYYSGSIDGVYGSGTESAVKKFQEKNGLTADGRTGPQTLEALGLPAGQNSGGGGGSGVSSGDLYLLARIISAEARGEPYAGQVAVGAVVLNRVEHPSFPNSVSGVIHQPGAFTALQDGQWNQPIADSAYKAARDAINGSDPSGGAIYYFNPSTATSKWIWSRPMLLEIGKHRFCS